MVDGRGGLLGTRLTAGAVRLLSRGLGRPFSPLPALLPTRRLLGRDVVLERDLPYHSDGKAVHRIDVYRPAFRAEGRPLVFYIHGGGFQTLSKDSHWVMALPFVKHDYVVVTINYRLAPEYPFPAALVDCARALQWVTERAHAFGADCKRMVFAGESAGANLALALTVLCCQPREPSWARQVFHLGCRPRALVSYYGLLQVTDAGRFQRENPKVPDWIQKQIDNVCDAYLDVDPRLPRELLDLVDPLIVLERGEATARPLPAIFGAVGTKDPLLPDTKRLAEAARTRGLPVEDRYYEAQIHGFHALGWTTAVRTCWTDTLAFLDTHV
jgi:acetyl esterase